MGDQMNKQVIILRYGEMMLKGKNLKDFRQKIIYHTHSSLKEFKLLIKKEYSKIIISDFLKKDLDKIIYKINHIPGFCSYSIGYIVKSSIDEIVKKSIEIIEKEIKESNNFKVVVKRLDKTIPNTSNELQVIIANKILDSIGDKIVPNLKEPKDILYIDINKEETLIYLSKIKLLGGKPTKSATKAIALLSGGIDSPVSAIEMIRQGINLSLIHFESSPLTPLESIDKVYDLAKVVSKYMPDEKINLYIVPFISFHKEILKNVKDQYIITIMRRAMYKIVNDFCTMKNISIISSGDSIGQVASQTLESLTVIDKIVDKSIIRPLATYDKEDIIRLAKKYETYDISIKPFCDCCTAYIPKSPATKPKLSICEIIEKKDINFIDLVNDAISKIVKLEVSSTSNLRISEKGLDFNQAYENILKEIK